MKIPDEVELISFFESEPILLDEVVPFYYNQATYIFSNKNNELFKVSISPSYREIKVEVCLSEGKELISFIEINNLESMEILVDKKEESKIMMTSPSSIIKMNFKPKYKIFMNQFGEK
ncbi:hypothetical protein [Sinanaerobacter sp. ZZT-01]|uniref:hypothetical protein n=1 Tax=Sinanaerobacter sp. ZZT-01 TaxID=3111540 RepID=UPI002D77C39D|nr:hypothetical protein [Sinanaerobacter sp. ZZT-01]WRR92446.1 hypothetical protein U5921_10275 [Sinanaerobacter sp. ZZT-01]